MSTAEWHIAKADAKAPEPALSDTELRARLRAGDIKDDDLIWCEGMNSWLKAGYFTWLLNEPDGS